MNKNSRKKLSNLVDKYCRGTASPEEKAFLEKYYSYFESEAKISDSLSQEEKEIIGNQIFEKINERIGNSSTNSGSHIYLRKYYRYAAAVIFTMLCVGTLLLLKDKSEYGFRSEGHKGLFNRKNISITTVMKNGPGSLAADNDTKIVKSDSSLLVYSKLSEPQKEMVATKTVTTPRGGEYKVTLPDGTEVWLNAVSCIKYPTVFRGKERVVEISGEVYLEVAKDANRPFIVKVNNTTEVKVLGTHFNINAYPEEGIIKTTLLEGSVQVTNISGAPVTLSPGQQSKTDVQGRVSVNNVDVNAVVAWKKGVFQFNSLDVDEIMRQISRWYDVDVIYQKEKPQGKYSGVVSRNTNLSEVMDMLEISGIRCTIEGQKIIVH